MNPWIALLVTVTMAGVDFCHARYVRALTAGRALPAASWSVGQFVASSVGFVVAVKISMWYLIFEALGLFLGTLLGGRKVTLPKAYVPRRSKDKVPSMPEDCGGC